jgi:predicted nucleic acid-binding protein
MIVVDTNIVVHLHINGEWTTQVLMILQKDPAWYSPPLWQSEFRNVLSGIMRKKLIDLNQARQIMEAALETMSGREIPVSSGRVLELAASSSCSAYDCEFVSLAQELGVKLITMDKQILAGFPGTALTPVEFTKNLIS